MMLNHWAAPILDMGRVVMVLQSAELYDWPVPAISIKEPWAGRMLNGKTIETRTWKTRFRGLSPIHQERGIPLLGSGGDEAVFGGAETRRMAADSKSSGVGEMSKKNGHVMLNREELHNRVHTLAIELDKANPMNEASCVLHALCGALLSGTERQLMNVINYNFTKPEIRKLKALVP